MLDRDNEASIRALEKRVAELENSQAEVMSVLGQHLALIRDQTTAVGALLGKVEELERRR